MDKTKFNQLFGRLVPENPLQGTAYMPATTYDMVAVSISGDDVRTASFTSLESYLGTMNTEISKKGTGTVTSVGVKVNGATKGTVTTSGTIDLGTVVTGVNTPKQIDGSTTLSHDSTFSAITNVSISGNTVNSEKTTFKMPSAATPETSWVNSAGLTLASGETIYLNVTGGKLTLTSTPAPEPTKYAILNVDPTSLTLSTTSGGKSTFNISSENLNSVSISHSNNAWSSYYSITSATTNGTITLTRTDMAGNGTIYDKITVSGTPASGADRSQLSSKTVNVAIPALTPTSIPVTGVTLKTPSSNYEFGSDGTNLTYTCSYTLTPSNATTGLNTTLSLYSDASHTTKATQATVSGNNIVFNYPCTVYPMYTSGNGIKSTATTSVKAIANGTMKLEMPTTAAFELGDTTQITLKPTTATFVDGCSLQSITGGTSSQSLSFTYFNVSCSTGTTVVITPKSVSTTITSNQTYQFKVIPGSGNPWVNQATAATQIKTVTVTVKPKTTTAAKGYYGLVDEQSDASWIKTSSFTNKISAAGNISITPSTGKQVVVLTNTNVAPSFSYKTGGVPCVGEVTKGSDWGGNNTLTMNGTTYYVWLIFDVMDASWTDVTLTIN